MRTRIATPYKTHLYSNFSGLNTSRADVSMERPQSQPAIEADNLYFSAKGYITNEPGLTNLGKEPAYVSHVRIHDASSDVVIYATRDAGGTSLRTHGGNAVSQNAWPREVSISSAVFNRRVVMAAGQRNMKFYNGSEFRDITSASIDGAKYVCQVSNRLVVAGFTGNPNEIQVSRVDNGTIYDGDEAIGEPSVLKAFRFNIKNMLGNGDQVRGLANFETSRIAVFTSDRVFVYNTDPDFTLWSLDKSVMVRYGTISHRSIVSAGSELFFCSRTGVHSLRRSTLGGDVVFSNAMTDDVTELYQQLLAKVENKDDVTAYFNPDEGRLHVIFPVNDRLSYRLSGAMTAMTEENANAKLRWTLSTYAGVTCGDYLSGRLIVGTISGIKTVAPWHSDAVPRGKGFVRFPTLWHEDLFEPKNGLHMILVASGVGKVTITSRDETGRELSEQVFELPDDGQVDYYGVPIQRQFIRPFQHEYLGVRITVTVDATKVIRIFAVGINVKANPKPQIR